MRGYGHFGGTFGRYGDANEMNMANAGSSSSGGGKGAAKAGELALEYGDDVIKFLGGLFKKDKTTEAEVVGTDTSVSTIPQTPRTAVAPDVQQRLLARRAGVTVLGEGAGTEGSGSVGGGPLGISWGLWGLGGIALGAAFLGRKKLRRAFR